MRKIIQTPAEGEHRLSFRGDTIEFKIELDQPLEGKAFLRTNLTRGATRRKEVIARTLQHRSGSAQDWHDIPMFKINETTYKVTIALLEVGHFEAMGFFLPENTIEPIWCGTKNVAINVEPSEYCCANSIYCAFPRQFGPNKYSSESQPIANLTEDKMKEYEEQGFTIIPPSGTFRDLIKELDFIIYELNCRIIHMLPINPTPTVYGKMGRYGSPYASLDFTNIDPSLAEFDRKATPLEQFYELVDEIHHRNAKLIIDLAINHTGWAAKIHEEHPEWLLRKEDGSIISPGAWGITWEDLTELDHKNQELRDYLADIFLTWTSRGVDGFRCDAAYMIPFEVWEYIICKVRESYPNTIFLLEGLGGDIQLTHKLLNEANMNWAYSELFQNYSKEQIESYVRYSHQLSKKEGIMVHYAETHDNNRLAATSETYARLRTAICALLSDYGAFGFTNGVEWFAKEKVDVHGASALNWNSKNNQIKYIGRINNILITHRAFQKFSSLEFINHSHQNLIAAIRTCSKRKCKLLLLINLDYSNQLTAVINKGKLSEFKELPIYDLITEKNHSDCIKKETLEINMSPGQVLCLTPYYEEIELLNDAEELKKIRPDIIDIQRSKANALDVICWKNRTDIISGIDTSNISKKFLENPIEFCRTVFPKDLPLPIIHWRWPEDLNRKVMIPNDHLLYITSPHRFRSTVKCNGDILIQKDSLMSYSGQHFIILQINNHKELEDHKAVELKLSVYGEDKCTRHNTELLLLAPDIEKLNPTLPTEKIRETKGTFLEGNQRGGMLRPCLKWNKIRDGYNCLLGANLNTEVPEDRHIMFNRARAWIIRQGRPEELNINTTKSFFINSQGGGTWTFSIPVGNGLYVDCSIAVNMVNMKNATRVFIYRHPSNNKDHYLSDDSIVHFIFRPDIEDRNFHHETKLNPELKDKWENSIQTKEKGFIFQPEKNRSLRMISSKGFYNEEAEWFNSIYREREAERGFEPYSDLFSPGYFKIDLTGGEKANITSQVLTDQENELVNTKNSFNINDLLQPRDNSFENVLLKSMQQFIVKRNQLKTVIAGYPWFLDWGRDTLICARGLISAGMYKDVKDILLQFAKYSKNGVLPNTIYGDSVGNWDTSDAPLWLIVACMDYCNNIDSNEILSEKVDKERTLLDAIREIIEGYNNGTPNGIKVDQESKLVYSPSHFTWMDTNYPAGTPRSGYPIEIQSLWYASLRFLAKADNNKNWDKTAEQVKTSILKYFVYETQSTKFNIDKEVWLSDCLHCDEMVPASQATKDDHLRCNQLLAVTLGAIDDKNIAKSVVDSSASLLVPGGIRSLADQKTSYKLPVYGNDGTLLNNPEKPYFGKYEGEENTKRKPAYHNGTAWTWPFPSYCEAYYIVYGASGIKHAKSVLSSSSILLEEGSFWQTPEILDGNLPHRQKGCDAQAWGITELYRVWKLLHSKI